MQAYRRQVGFEDEDELMQYAIQQSLIETGTENDEVHEKNVGLLISLERAFMDVFFGAIKIPKLWVSFKFQILHNIFLINLFLAKIRYFSNNSRTVEFRSRFSRKNFFWSFFNILAIE